MARRDVGPSVRSEASTGNAAVGVNRIRWRNAAHLATQFGGSVRFGEKVGVSKQQASHMWGKNPVRNIGTANARRIERAAGMPPGWLDVDHDGVMLAGQGSGVALSTSRAAPPISFDQASGRGTGPTFCPLTYLAEWIAQSLPDAAVRSVQVLANAPAAMPTNTIALVDCSIQKVLDDGAYVLEFSGLRVVRRATRQIDGSWLLTAESGGGEPSRVAQADEARLHVVGRVIGAVRLERM